MKKLCYVVPDYDPRSPTHFAHLNPFLEELKRNFNLFLIVEKKLSQWFPLRVLQMKARLLAARSRGYRDFYVHYSFLAAFLASFVVRVCGGRVFYWNCGEPWKYQRPFLRERFERMTYRLVDCLVTGTEGLADQYAAHYRIPREKIRVMPNWITLEAGHWKLEAGERDRIRNTLRIPKNHRVVLFVHRLSKRKGAQYLPEIIREFKDEPVTFLVVGDGPEKKDIQLLITSYQLQNNIRFLGSVPNYELPNYYLLADVFLMPSDEEGFPHVLLEAMAAGVPYVATRVGGVQDITPPSLQPYFVPAGDVQAISQGVSKLLDLSFHEREALGREEQAWVKQFDLQSIIPIFKQIVS